MTQVRLKLELEGLNVQIVDQISHLMDLQKKDVEAVVKDAVDKFDFTKYVGETTEKLLKQEIDGQLGHWARSDLRNHIRDAIKGSMKLEIKKS